METKKTIGQMSDIAALFLALYAINFKREDDRVYFSKNIKMLLKKASIESTEELLKLSCYDEILDENGAFNIEEFINQLSLSQTKKHWRDAYHFDLENDAIYTFVETKTAANVIESYDETNVDIVNTMVENYILYQEKCVNESEDISINVQKRKYTRLLEIKRSDD